MNNAQKLEAIQALLNSEWDNEQLQKLNELFPEKTKNIQAILDLPTVVDYPVFIPETANNKWDATEVQPVAIIDDSGTCDVCEPEQADFWSTYLHLKEGGAVCVADLQTQDQAIALANLIENAAKSYQL